MIHLKKTCLGFLITLNAVSLVPLSFAGSLDSPASPSDSQSAMFDLSSIYTQLTTGSVGAKRSGSFTEPVSGPTAGTGYSLDQIQAVLPVVDDVNGAAPTDVLSGKKYWGLRSDGSWGLQTGSFSDTSQIAQTPVTGQQTSYVSGDDGALKKGLAWPNPRFLTNGDGTVTDALTNLVWLQNANCFGDNETWSQALADANTLANGSCGLSDNSTAGLWRLPNLNEIESLRSLENSNPALPNGHPFSGVQNLFYWTSSSNQSDPNASAWAINQGLGAVLTASKTNLYYVWPVRDAF